MALLPKLASPVWRALSGGNAWSRAAWYGWQFMPLRSARDAMGGTIRALREGGVPVAHRFVGVARQRGSSRGTLHSDHRNYMLSTLTPLVVPGPCGVVGRSRAADGLSYQDEERRLVPGEAVLLDNSFPHQAARIEYLRSQPGHLQSQSGHLRLQPGHIRSQPEHLQSQPGHLRSQHVSYSPTPCRTRCTTTPRRTASYSCARSGTPHSRPRSARRW